MPNDGAKGKRVTFPKPIFVIHLLLPVERMNKNRIQDECLSRLLENNRYNGNDAEVKQGCNKERKKEDESQINVCAQRIQLLISPNSGCA